MEAIGAVITIREKIQNSPFRNVYWFSRYLMNTDQYGAPGKTKELQLMNLVAVLETLTVQQNFSDNDKLQLLKNTLTSEIIATTNAGTKARSLALNLAQKLEQEIKNVDDVLVFCIAMKYVVAPINRAMALIPADDKNSVQRRRKIFLTLSAKKKLIC